MTIPDSFPESRHDRTPAVSRQPAAQQWPLPQPRYVDWGGGGLPTFWDPEGLNRHWHVLGRHKTIILATALCGAIAGFVAAAVQTPVYRARVLLEIENLNRDFLNLRAVTPTEATSAYESPEYNIRTQTMVLQSTPVLQRVADQPDIISRLGEPATSHDTAARAAQALASIEAFLKVKTFPNTRVVEVSYDSPDPRLAADVVNGVAAAYSEESRDDRWRASQNTTQWLIKQVADVKRDLEHSEDALQEYASKAHLMILSDDKGNAAEDSLRQIQSQLSTASADRIAKQAAVELLTKTPLESLPQELDDPTLKDYDVELTTLKRQAAELGSTYAPGYSKVRSVNAQIASLEKAIDHRRSELLSRVQSDYTAAARREDLLQAAYVSQVAVVSNQAAKSTRYEVLKRAVDAKRDLYDQMIQRVKEAGLASAMQASDIRVIDPATPPDRPFKPDYVLNTLAGLFAGMLVGAGALIAKARSDRGILDPGQIPFELNLPELGVIPSTRTQLSAIQRVLNKARSDKADGPEINTWQRWPSEVSESFRITLTSMLLSRNGVPTPRVVVLTSANPGEGKTTVASHLAVALAMVNRRVLVIDGDLRKPRMHEVFQVNNSAGFGEALESQDIRSVVQETRIPNLNVISSGHGADEKLLFTPSLSRIVHELQNDYDIILIDSPPVLLVPDARLLGHCSDAVILVVAQHTQRDDVQQAQQRLAEDGSRLLGTILNNWDPRDSSHGDRNRSYYYRRYN